jgi:hypothetical protein
MHELDIPNDLLEVPRSRIRLVAGQGRICASSGWVLSQRAPREQTERRIRCKVRVVQIVLQKVFLNFRLQGRRNAESAE